MNENQNMETNAGFDLNIPKGMRDILPEDHEYLTFIKKVVRHRCRQSGYRRISTPILEQQTLFQKTLGPIIESDNQKLYQFHDAEENLLALKPEGTSGIIRAYKAHDMREWPKPVELFYIEPYFEFVAKSKKQFYRSYLEFGAETIGEADPAIDAQVMHLAYKVLQDLNISALFSLQINNLGCEECLGKYLLDLENYFVGKERALCFDCQNRLSNDLLGILRCSEEDCKILVTLAPKISNYWCGDCKLFFGKLLSYLQELQIPYHENHTLVGHYNFYNRTVFQFWDIDEKQENVVARGGRYDYLIEKFGLERTPAVGFSMRLEKVVRAMKKEKIRVPSKDGLHVFVAQLSDEAKKKCLVLMMTLRDMGIKTVGVLGKGSIREQISIAGKFGVPYMLIMGLTEVRENVIILRDMRVGQQRIIAFDEASNELKKIIGEKNLDTYSPGEFLY